MTERTFTIVITEAQRLRLHAAVRKLDETSPDLSEDDDIALLAGMLWNADPDAVNHFNY